MHIIKMSSNYLKLTIFKSLLMALIKLCRLIIFWCFWPPVILFPILCHFLISPQNPVFLNYLSTKMVPYENKWCLILSVVPQEKDIVSKSHLLKVKNRLAFAYQCLNASKMSLHKKKTNNWGDKMYPTLKLPKSPKQNCDRRKRWKYHTF